MGKSRAPAQQPAAAATGVGAHAAGSAKPQQQSPLLALAILGALLALLLSQWSSLAALLSPSDTATLSALTDPTALPAPPSWGPYRPNLYLGFRGLWPQSPLVGWAWSCTTAPTSTGGDAAAAAAASCSAQDQIESLRHDAEERDGVSKYGWLQHNGRDFGVHGILDRRMGVNFTASYIQPRTRRNSSPSDSAADEEEVQTDRWVLRLSAEAVGSREELDASARQAAAKGERSISLFFYTALADPSHKITLLDDTAATPDQGGKSIVEGGSELSALLHAGAEAGGDGTLLLRSGVSRGSAPPSRVQSYYLGRFVDESPPERARPGRPAPPPQQYAWAAKEHIQRALSDQYRPRWQAFSQRVARMQREHEERAQRGQGPRTPFVPPQPEHAVLSLPNQFPDKQSKGQHVNFFVVQHVISLPFTMDFVLQPAEDAGASGADTTAEVAPSMQQEVGSTERWFARSGAASLAQALAQRKAEFEQRFARTFPLALASQQLATQGRGQVQAVSDSMQHEVAQALLSNLLGGIGYFHGRQLIEEVPERRDPRSGAVISPARVREEPVAAAKALFTCTPSRSFFPRGFMWDEGFHQLLVSRWDLELSLRVLGSWFDKIKLDSLPVGGWLPREQIRGEESRRRVPREFQAQKPDVANPPTMVLALERILQRLLAQERAAAGTSAAEQAKTHRELALFNAFLVRWLPVLHVHVGWFFRTQASVASGASPAQIGVIDLATGELPTGSAKGQQGLPVAFRWAGRSKDHCLASGLDDYPRAKWIPTLQDKTPASPSPRAARQRELDAASTVPGLAELVERVGAEGHVDLHAWMLLLSNTMAGLMDYAHKHQQQEAQTHGGRSDSASINYSAVAASYRSYSSVLLDGLWSLHWDASEGSFADWAYRNGSRVFVGHKGYVSLMPLFLGLLEQTPTGVTAEQHDARVLSLLRSLRPKEDFWSLWSPAGLRSLSRRDKAFGSGEDYWRGHVWINMQYLACSGLDRLADGDSAGVGGALIGLGSEVRSLARALGTELRQRVSRTVASEYASKGFVYEQYHALSGAGRKSHPFTGWTALTLELMTKQQQQEQQQK